MTHRGYYAVIPATVRYDQRLTNGAKLMYGEITALATERGYCYASNRYFAEIYGVTAETISRMISKLEELDYIEVETSPSHAAKGGTERKIYLLEQVLDKKIKTLVTKMSSTLKRINSKNLITDDSLDKNSKESCGAEQDSAPTPPPKFAKEIKEVFEYWYQVFGKTRAILNSSKEGKIRARLTEKWTVDDLKLAITGVLKSPHHMGTDPRGDGTKYIEIETIFRTSTQVEKFIELATKKTLAKERQVPRGNAKPCELCAKGIGPCPAHRGKVKSERTSTGELTKV